MADNAPEQSAAIQVYGIKVESDVGALAGDEHHKTCSQTRRLGEVELQRGIWVTIENTMDEGWNQGVVSECLQQRGQTSNNERPQHE